MGVGTPCAVSVCRGMVWFGLAMGGGLGGVVLRKGSLSSVCLRADHTSAQKGADFPVQR